MLAGHLAERAEHERGKQNQADARHGLPPRRFPPPLGAARAALARDALPAWTALPPPLTPLGSYWPASWRAPSSADPLGTFSATRNTALRARGLAATSSAEARSGLPITRSRGAGNSA